jgi:hypothetical protein
MLISTVALRPMLDAVDETLYSEKCSRAWSKDAEPKHVRDVVEPILVAGDLTGDTVLKKQVSLLAQAFGVLHAGAALKMWRDEAGDSKEKAALTQLSSNLVKAASKALEELDSFVEGVCGHAGDKDVTIAIQFSEKRFPHHEPSFDDFPWGKLVSHVRGETSSLITAVVGQWKDVATALYTITKDYWIDWTVHADDLMKPECQQLVLSLLKNPGYQKLSALATSMLSMMALARATSLFDKQFVDQCMAEANCALRLVSVTFTLFHVKVQWPKLRGHKNQQAARATLLKQHDTSAFKESWTCLPKPLQDFVESFGGEA